MSVTPASQPPASALPRVLLQAKLLTAQQVESITRSSTSEKIPFIDALIKSGAMQPVALAQFCSQTFGHPLLDLTALDTQSLPEKVIDDRLMQTQRVVVLAKRSNKVCVAIADPTHGFVGGSGDRGSAAITGTDCATVAKCGAKSLRHDRR